jgi:hypothetical protein
MKNKHKMIVSAFFAVLMTYYGLDTAIGGLQAGYPSGYALGAFLVPFLLWLATVHFYEEYKKEKKEQ